MEVPIKLVLIFYSICYLTSLNGDKYQINLILSLQLSHSYIYHDINVSHTICMKLLFVKNKLIKRWIFNPIDRKYCLLNLFSYYTYWIIILVYN
jgi:hypothetical protein